MYYLKCRLYRW